MTNNAITAGLLIYFQLFNTESEAIGYFEHLNDTVMAEMTYFDFGGFNKDNSTSGLNIKSESGKHFIPL